MTKKSDVMMQVEKAIRDSDLYPHEASTRLGVDEGTIENILQGRIDKVAYKTLLAMNEKLDELIG